MCATTRQLGVGVPAPFPAPLSSPLPLSPHTPGQQGEVEPGVEVEACWGRGVPSPPRCGSPAESLGVTFISWDPICLPGPGCPGLSTQKTGILPGELQRSGSMVKVPYPPGRGAKAGNTQAAPALIPFPGLFHSPAVSCYREEGWSQAGFLEEAALSWCLWGWARLGEQGQGGRKDLWQEVGPWPGP